MSFLKAMFGLRLMADSVGGALSTYTDAVDASDTRSDALDVLSLEGAKWISAGEVRLAADGTVVLPTLPPVPGVRRRDHLASDGTHGVGLAPAANLAESMSVESEEDRRFITNTRAEILAGSTIRFYYLTEIVLNDELLDLSIEENREAVLQALEIRVDASPVADVSRRQTEPS